MLLETITSPDDIKKLDIKQLRQLCSELREQLVKTVTKTGGHLSSNLGAVELTVALHYVFDSQDKIVWDVGHQSYIHKMLTGRNDKMLTIRSKGGLSGFCDPSESPYDAVVTGHASTAISSALGLALARDISGENHKVVAVLGDGALTGGMTYEALNNIKDTQLLIVLNDNNMSIEKNVGRLASKISKFRVGSYYKDKQRVKRILKKIPLVGKPTYKFLHWCKRRMKLAFIRPSYFDSFDIKYIGAVNGNDVKELIYYFNKIKNNFTNKPVLLHITTKKGKGYEPAEQNQSLYHNYYISKEKNTLSSKIVGDTLCQLASYDKRVCAISAAMKESVGLGEFFVKYPDRTFDVGIAEEHAVTFAGGLATGGMRPYVLIYSTFLQRAYDQIIHDIAISKLPVTFLLDRAGFVGSDGKTHQGLQDLSYLTSVPNMTVFTPFSQLQLKQMVEYSINHNGPLAIRYSKTLSDMDCSFDYKWNILVRGNCPVRVLAVGTNMVNNAMLANTMLEQQFGLKAEIVGVTTVKPLDNEYLDTIKDCTLITLEENQINGGFGSLIAKYFSDRADVTVHIKAVEDVFVEHATVSEQLSACKLDETSIFDKLIELAVNKK